MFNNSVVNTLSGIGGDSELGFSSLYKVSYSYLLLLGGKPDSITRKYDFESNKWTDNKKIVINKFDFSTSLYKDKKIFIIGGKAPVNLHI